MPRRSGVPKRDVLPDPVYGSKVDFDTVQHKLYALAQIQWHIYDSNELISGLVLEYQNIHSAEFMNGQGVISNDDGDVNDC